MDSPEEPTYALTHYAGVLKRRSWIFISVLLVTVWVGGLYTFYQPPLYRASMTLLLVLPLDQINPNNIEQETNTKAALLKSTDLANQVAQRLRLPTGGQQLLGALHVVKRPESATLEVQFDSRHPDQALRILREFDLVFRESVEEQREDAGLQSGQPDSAPSPTGSPLQPSPVPSAQALLNPLAGIRDFDLPHPVGKVQPQPARTLAVAGALGLFLGLVAAFVREQFDETVRSVGEAEHAFGQGATAVLPRGILGYRPFGPRRRGGPDPVVTELSIQRLAADILWSPEEPGTRSLLVTSAHPEEGKTTVTANLAVELAASGHTVTVVEADLRRPMLRQYLGLDRSTRAIGLDEVLRGAATVAAALVDIPVWDRSSPNRPGSSDQIRRAGRLQAILADPTRGWPSEVGMDRITEVLTVLQSQADYVIIDAPPILVVPDAYPLVTAVDAVAAVVRSGRSTTSATAAFSALLARLRASRVELIMIQG